MKKIIYSILAIGSLAMFNSCTSDPCKDKSATTLCSGNGTLAASGSTCGCTCNTGYEGTSCSSLSTDKMLGTWSATDNNTSYGAVGPYSSAVAVGSSTGTVIMGNFSNLGANVNATVSGTTLTIPNQVLGTAYTVSGSGTFSTSTTGSSILTMSYTLVKVSTSTSYPYTGTWTK